MTNSSKLITTAKSLFEKIPAFPLGFLVGFVIWELTYLNVDPRFIDNFDYTGPIQMMVLLLSGTVSYFGKKDAWTCPWAFFLAAFLTALIHDPSSLNLGPFVIICLSIMSIPGIIVSLLVSLLRKRLLKKA